MKLIYLNNLSDQTPTTKKKIRLSKVQLDFLKEVKKFLMILKQIFLVKQAQGKRRPGMLSCVAKVSDCSRLKI